MPLLAELGVAEKRIYYDKFTTTGDPTTEGRRSDDDRQAPRTQRSEAGLHRRRGRRQGVPGLDRAPVQLLHPAEAQADPLRGRHRRGAARPAALPRPGLAVRVLRRPRRLPAGLDRAQGVGLRPARARARPGLRRQGLRLAGARLARVPRPQRGVGAHALPLQLQRRPPAQPERRGGPPGQGVRAVEPQLGALRGAARRRLDARRPRPRASTCSPTPTGGRRRTCTTTRSR